MGKDVLALLEGQTFEPRHLVCDLVAFNSALPSGIGDFASFQNHFWRQARFK
jgi:hypothetical protein